VVSPDAINWESLVMDPSVVVSPDAINWESLVMDPSVVVYPEVSIMTPPSVAIVESDV